MKHSGSSLWFEPRLKCQLCYLIASDKLTSVSLSSLICKMGNDNVHQVRILTELNEMMHLVRIRRDLALQVLSK